MKISKIISLFTLSISSSIAFALSYNLYSDASAQSQVVTTVTPENQGEYIRFYIDKDGKWAKYANSSTGEVGWVDLGAIEKQKADALRKDLLKSVDEQGEGYVYKPTTVFFVKDVFCCFNFINISICFKTSS